MNGIKSLWTEHEIFCAHKRYISAKNVARKFPPYSDKREAAYRIATELQIEWAQMIEDNQRRLN